MGSYYIQVAVHTKERPKNNLVFVFAFAKCKWTIAVKHGDTNPPLNIHTAGALGPT